MPRTKGAKNKEKSLEFYLKKVEQLTGKVPKVGAIVEKINDVNTEISKARKRIKLEIEKPKNNEPEKEKNSAVDLKGTVIRCGNPACNKILQKEENICPFCGVKLTW